MTTTASEAGGRIAGTPDSSEMRAYPRGVSRAGTRAGRVTIATGEPSPSTGGLHQCRHQWCTRRAGAAGLCRQHHTVQSHWQADGFTDAAPVRRHLRALLDAGLSVRAIHCVTGVDHRELAQLVIGAPAGGAWPHDRIPAGAAQLILGVPAPTAEANPEDTDAGRDEVPAIGTARRLRALVSLGHPRTHLAARLGWQAVTISTLLSTDHPTVPVAVAHRVAALFDELQMQPGPCEQSRAAAAAARWAAPLAWDDHAIDNPAATPQRPRRNILWDERYEELRALGYRTRTDIAERLGVSVDSLDRQLQRYGLAGELPS
jgi:hypothetical protein